MSQPGYDPNQYPPAPQYAQPPQYAGYPPYQQQGYPPGYLQGQKHKETSLIFGIIGLFVLGFVFGPLAIINANKAEALGHQATAGKVLGWVDSIMSILGVLFIAGIYAFAAVATSEGWN